MMHFLQRPSRTGVEVTTKKRHSWGFTHSVPQGLCRIPNPESRTPNPEPRTPNPEPRTPNADSDSDSARTAHPQRGASRVRTGTGQRYMLRRLIRGRIHHHTRSANALARQHSRGLEARDGTYEYKETTKVDQPAGHGVGGQEVRRGRERRLGGP